jgi:hypothetical protein
MTVLQALHCIVTISSGPTFLASENVVTGLAACQYCDSEPANASEANAPRAAVAKNLMMFDFVFMKPRT